MKALAGKNILITRPEGQSDNLARLVREQGGNPILFPAIEILPLENPTELARIFARLEDHHLAIFVSANAVTHSLPHLPRGWPKNVAVAAMGEGTAKALKAFGIDQVIVPKTGADSESLLESAELKRVRGKKVLIFRGQGGRELLKQILV
ncbi:MAG: uroporphyrinogen-III synthase, partial [Burkholderiales bacterium]